MVILRRVRVLGGSVALTAVLAAVVLAPGAAGSPASDTAAILRDFSNRDIASCRFTRKQLERALGQLSGDADAYAESAAVRAEIDREIKRWKTGGCKGRKIILRIVSIKPKGEAATESVTIRNVSRKTLNLRRYALRDSADHTIRFGNLKLKRGQNLRVVTGCRRGESRAVRRGSTYNACRKTQFWDDGGDVIELVTPQGGLLSTKHYGTPPAP
jgi:hypothetical protein